jgi:hypothetical protein
MLDGARKTHERLKRQREMNGLPMPGTQLTARKRTAEYYTPPVPYAGRAQQALEADACT